MNMEIVTGYTKNVKREHFLYQQKKIIVKRHIYNTKKNPFFKLYIFMTLLFYINFSYTLSNKYSIKGSRNNQIS